MDLRGYGKVSANFTANQALFECEDAGKADILLDKLQADLFWDKTVPVKKTTLAIGSSKVTIYSLAGHGSAVIARSGKSVVVLGASDESQTAALAAKEPLLLGGDVTSQAAKPHPLSLDYFDNKAYKAYVQPMKSSRGFGIESHWPFMKALGGALAFFGPMISSASPAPGVAGHSVDDYEVGEAERQGDMVVVGPNGGGEVPLWAGNAFPDNMMKPSDTTALGDWGGAGMAGAHYESWATPPEQRSLTGLGFLQRAMERYKSSPAVGGWMLFAGSPGVEYNFHGRATRTWDTSPTGQKGWRRWLQEEKHWSLRDLGSRWYGEPRHFANWDEVRVPDMNEFFGALGPDSFRLATDWRWRNSAAFAPSPIPSEAPGWIPLSMPPSQQQAFLPRDGVNYFDVTLNPTSWLQKQRKGADVWLVFGMIGTGKDAARAWLNGKAVELPADAASKDGPFAIRVTGLLKAGPNHLQVALECASAATCAGKLAGPVFLTTHEPKRLPYLGRQANARYADLIEWQCWAITEYHRQMFSLARKLDADRPFVLSGAGSAGLVNDGIQLAVDYGMGIENTGRESFYVPWPASLAIPAGYYPTSEWAGTPLGDKLDRGFGWILFDADASHCDYYNIEDFQQREKEDGWYTRHRRQIQLFGKYLRVQPKLALLHSDESSRFGSTEPMSWDIGRGEIQAAHYDNVYVTEQGVMAGLADGYPVLFDTASEFMEPKAVEAIRKYVEKGGTFVASFHSGRHTALDPDSYSLSELTGFQVISHGGKGKVKFETSLPIFKGWEGREFEGQGEAIDWQNADHAKGGAGLSPLGKESIPLARWSDGSVAIGYRHIGKGRVIILGTTFWRHGKDIEGIWRSLDPIESQFLTQLLTDCGVSRDADATAPEVWARKMVTKNGLQNWLLASNSTPAARESDVWMRTDGKPEEVIDLDANAKVPFVFEDGGIRIRGLRFDPYEVKVFAINRGGLVAGLPIWWQEKMTYWKRTPTQTAARGMKLFASQQNIGENVIPLGKWRFQTDPDGAITDQGKWTALTFDDAAWKVTEAGPWNLFHPSLKDYHGTGLYRIKFNVPQSWAGGRILLNLYDNDAPIVYDAGEFSINGIKVTSYKSRGWSQMLNYDVTERIHPGENILALEAIGGPKLGGLSGSVWIESRQPLRPSLDLKGPWHAVKGDWLTRVNATVPGSATAKYLVREIDIPLDWKGRSVYLDWASKNQWVGAVVINGMPICNNAFAHPFGLLARVNITPYLRPGERNVLEVWPFKTMTLQGSSAEEGEADGLQLDAISIGCKPADPI